MPKGDTLSPACNHQAEIVSSCTSFEPTTRQQAGSVVYILVPHCPTPPSVDGLTMMESSIAIDWMRSPPAQCAVLKLLVYKCVHSCKLTKCTCMANRPACKYMRTQKRNSDENACEPPTRVNGESTRQHVHVSARLKQWLD